MEIIEALRNIASTSTGSGESERERIKRKSERNSFVITTSEMVILAIVRVSVEFGKN